MESIKISELVQCVSQYLMRELQELAKPQQKRISISEYCSKTRSLLKRLKKIISWVRTSSQFTSKQQELEAFTSTNFQMQKNITGLIASLHTQQLSNLRTPPFAISEAADVLCRGEYCGFPSLGYKSKPSKIPLSKLTRIVKHKSLMSEMPIGAEIEIANGKLQVTRDEHEILFSINDEFKWTIFDFKVKHQELTIPQKEIILKEILEGISKCDESEVIIVTDMQLQRKSHCEILDILYKQSKNLKDVTVSYTKGLSLTINYWPAFPSSIMLNIESESIEIFHNPKLPYSITFTKDLSEILQQAISLHKKLRLESFFLRPASPKIYLSLQGENTVSIDISYFTGEFIVCIMGKLDPDLSSCLKFQSLEKALENIDEKVMVKKFQSICRSMGKELVQEPLRFCRSFYFTGPGARVSGVLGYVDLGSVLPMDSMGHTIIFALRIFGSPVSSELVGFNQTEEEYNILIDENFTGDIEEYLQKAIKKGIDYIMMLRIPLMLLAKPLI